MNELRTPTLKIACSTVANAPYPVWEYAVLEVDSQYLTGLIQRMGFAELCAKYASSFYRCSFFDCDPPTYYRELLLNEQIADDNFYEETQQALDDGNWVILPAHWAAPGDGPGQQGGTEVVGRTECEMLAINADSVLYSAIPKGAESSAEITSQLLLISQVTTLLGELQMRISHPAVRQQRVITLAADD